MTHKPLDYDKIARALGATRGGPLRTGHGGFGAAQLAEELRERFRTPLTGGRPTDPAWTEQRLVKLAPSTLEKLETIARDVTAGGQPVAPLQVAALLLERAVSAANGRGVARLARKKRSA